MRRFILCLIVSLGHFSWAEQDVHSGVWDFNESPSHWVLALFSKDNSWSCFHAGIHGASTVIVGNRCSKPVYFSWCRLRSGAGINPSDVKCAAGKGLGASLSAHENGEQIGRVILYPVPTPRSAADISREYIILTSSFEADFPGSPAFRVEGDNVLIDQPEGQTDVPTDEPPSAISDEPYDWSDSWAPKLPSSLKAFVNHHTIPSYVLITRAGVPILKNPESSASETGNLDFLSPDEKHYILVVENVKLFKDGQGAAVEVHIDEDLRWIQVPFTDLKTFRFCGEGIDCKGSAFGLSGK